MKRNAGYLYLLITFFCWGSIYVVSKYALAVMGPVTVSFCRYLVSVVCLYGILKWKGGHKKIAKEHWPYLLILGGLGYFACDHSSAGRHRASVRLSGIPDQFLKSGYDLYPGSSLSEGKDHLEKCAQHCSVPDRCLHYTGQWKHADQSAGNPAFCRFCGTVVCGIGFYPQNLRLL